jgi:hypothetical protein
MSKVKKIPVNSVSATRGADYGNATYGVQTETEEARLNAKEILVGIIERQDRDALHDWILFYMKVNIPRVVITEGHKAPFDFVADYLFGLITFAVVMANRSGGKTFIFGILATILSFVNDDTEIATVGAIQQQALKSYEYFQSFSSLFPFAFNVTSFTMRQTELKNGSKYQVLAGTMSGVNSPHPQLAFFDEIDLMPWQILQQGLSMPQSKKGVRARTVLTSTRKFAGGVMQRMLDEAATKGYAVYFWNIWEVVAPLPVNNPELMERIKRVFGDELPEDIDQANGYYDWEDLIDKKLNLEDEVWATEWVCSRPGLQGIIYGTAYSDENNLITPDEGMDLWKPPERGYIYLAEDFGHSEGHPNVILPVWIPTTFDRLVVFDELYVDDRGTDEIWEAANEILAPYNLELPNKPKGIQGNIRGWACDPHNLALIHERKVRGAPVLPDNKEAKLYLLQNSIPIVKKFMRAGRIMITSKCVNLRMEILSYQWRKNANGTWSNTVTKKEDDHGPDALRYLLLAIGADLERNWLRRAGKHLPEKTIEKNLKADKFEEYRRNAVKNEKEAPITAGLMDMKF